MKEQNRLIWAMPVTFDPKGYLKLAQEALRKQMPLPPGLTGLAKANMRKCLEVATLTWPIQVYLYDMLLKGDEISVEEFVV